MHIGYLLSDYIRLLRINDNGFYAWIAPTGRIKSAQFVRPQIHQIISVVERVLSGMSDRIAQLCQHDCCFSSSVCGRYVATDQRTNRRTTEMVKQSTIGNSSVTTFNYGSPSDEWQSL